ncbi:hypothetical protein Hanom_Chr16g01518381 [Helianthus anomalus]
MTVWTSMESPLVCMFPNSTTLFLPGICNNNPGDNSTNSTTAITTGPQSAIFCHCLLIDLINFSSSSAPPIYICIAN